MSIYADKQKDSEGLHKYFGDVVQSCGKHFIDNANVLGKPVEYSADGCPFKKAYRTSHNAKEHSVVDYNGGVHTSVEEHLCSYLVNDDKHYDKCGVNNHPNHLTLLDVADKGNFGVLHGAVVNASFGVNPKLKP